MCFNINCFNRYVFFSVLFSAEDENMKSDYYQWLLQVSIPTGSIPVRWLYCTTRSIIIRVTLVLSILSITILKADAILFSINTFYYHYFIQAYSERTSQLQCTRVLRASFTHGVQNRFLSKKSVPDPFLGTDLANLCLAQKWAHFSCARSTP